MKIRLRVDARNQLMDVVASGYDGRTKNGREARRLAEAEPVVSVSTVVEMAGVPRVGEYVDLLPVAQEPFEVERVVWVPDPDPDEQVVAEIELLGELNLDAVDDPWNWEGVPNWETETATDGH